MYVIKRLDQGGGYVAISGHPSSYTNSIRLMRRYDTYEEAKNSCCGNEMPVLLEDLLS